MRPRTTVLGLMGLVLFATLALAALRTNSEVWAAVVLALTVAALDVATLFAIYRRGAWAGFAVFGWAQFLICQPHTAPDGGLTYLTIGLVVRFFPVLDTRPYDSPCFRNVLCLLCLAVAGLGAIVGGWVDRRCTSRGRVEPPPESVNAAGVRNDNDG